MREPFTRPVVRVELTLPGGEVLAREWSINDFPPEVEIQPWMGNPRRSWDHPQDPITYKADVPSGGIAMARGWLADLKRLEVNDG